jgi:hypothetical protein
MSKVLVTLHTTGGSMAEAIAPINSLVIDAKDQEALDAFIEKHFASEKELEFDFEQIPQEVSLPEAENLVVSWLDELEALQHSGGIFCLSISSFSWIHGYDVSLAYGYFKSEEDALIARDHIAGAFPSYALIFDIFEVETGPAPREVVEQIDKIEHWLSSLENIGHLYYTRVHPKPDFSPGKFVQTSKGEVYQIIKQLKFSQVSVIQITPKKEASPKTMQEYDFVRNVPKPSL